MKIKKWYLLVIVLTFIIANIKVFAINDRNVQPLSVKKQFQRCDPCVPAPGQQGVVYWCPEGPVDNCALIYPCGYGVCD